MDRSSGSRQSATRGDVARIRCAQLPHRLLTARPEMNPERSIFWPSFPRKRRAVRGKSRDNFSESLAENFSQNVADFTLSPAGRGRGAVFRDPKLRPTTLWVELTVFSQLGYGFRLSASLR